MSEIISKELLSEVLGYEVTEIYGIVGNELRYETSDFEVHMKFSPFKCSVNIYELAHKCKEKAREYGYSITTGNRVDGTDRYDVLCIHKDEDIECGEAVFFNEIVDTEPNGCFMAMQWILDNKDK